MSLVNGKATLRPTPSSQSNDCNCGENSSLVNGKATLRPTPSSQSNDYNCGENSSLGSNVGVGLLLFTNIITVIVFIISCLWLLRSRRKHGKL